MKIYLLVFTTVLYASISFAQETKNNKNGSIEGEFDKIYRISTNYQVYKVINKEKFLSLKQQVLDSLKTSQNQIIIKNNLLKEAQVNESNTKEILYKTKLELETSLQRKDSIFLFGKQLSKTIYNLILWSIILVLLAGLIYFILKFKNNIYLTKKAEKNLKDVEIEYEQHRKKTLDREQKLRRTFQDEINKQRNS